MPTLGPVELLVIGFPGDDIPEGILPLVRELQSKGTIRVIDAVLVVKDPDGSVSTLEIDELETAARTMSSNPIGEMVELLSDEDVRDFADALEPGGSVGAVLVEHSWATPLSEAIGRADGELLLSLRVPHDAFEVLNLLRQAS